MRKTLYTPLLLALAAVTQAPASAAAQYDDLLIVEKRKDLAARTRLLTELRKTSVSVNFEDASAKDVLELIAHIQNVVEEKTGVKLEREIVVMGG